MKTSGLSSKVKKGQRETTRAVKFANLETIHSAMKERQKSLRMQAEAAQLLRQKKDALKKP